MPSLRAVSTDSLKRSKVLPLVQSAHQQQKACPWSRVVPRQPKAKILYNTFIMSCFNYSPLIWMFCGKTASREIDRIHKRALRLVLNDFDSPFETLLCKANECTVHQRNLQKLMLEIYKCLHFENPSFMWEFFEKKDLTYNLRTQNLLRAS